MMSSQQIVAMSRAAARRSAREHVVPLLVEKEDLVADVTLRRHLRGIPFIGDRVPRGWKLMHAASLLGSDTNCVPWWPDEPSKAHAYMQVDSSGLGAEGEPSFTQAGFCEAVRKIGPGYGYAMAEQGQFQVVVGVFRPAGA